MPRTNPLRYVALATDFDETLAEHGAVRPETVAALERLKASGRRLVLVTGRDLADLRSVFPALGVFDAVVAENGGVLYVTATREERMLAEPASGALVERLEARKVEPLHVGRVIVATRDPHQHIVLDEINRLGLELQVIFNKGAVMVLPAGAHKGTGLAAAVAALGLSLRNTVAVGDAENDHALIAGAECGVAVANALPALKQRADLVTEGRAGAGVIELAGRLLVDDLASVALPRRDVELGRDDAGEPVALPSYGPHLLFAGLSGSGKSTAAMAVLERLIAAGYQCLILDPEGDYERFPDALVLGDAERPPTVAEIATALGKPGRSVAVNLVGMSHADRPELLRSLLPRLGELRAATGRPHWIFLEEAHHLMPVDLAGAPQALSAELGSLAAVTVIPHELAPALLQRFDTVVAVGKHGAQTLEDYAGAAGRGPVPEDAPDELARGEVILWRIGRELRRFTVAPTRTKHRRHLRKYAQGALARDRHFVFRGPTGAMNLRAQNLTVFAQLADGVDEKTWRYHLEAGDYARWFRDVIGDEELALAAEEAVKLPPAQSRARILAAIAARYTLPATTGEPAAT